MIQQCPLCQCSVTPSPRYPGYVCAKCMTRASTEDGQLLGFSQQSAGGGYRAFYAESGLDYPTHECFIDGVRCRADEAYMGGIVIVVADAD